MYCLTVTHPNITTLRLVNDRRNLTRTAGTFTAFPFEVKGAVSASEQMPEIHITVDNVDQRLTRELRSIAGNPDEVLIQVEIVLASAPNDVVMGPMPASIRGVSNDLATLQLVCPVLPGLLNEPFPGRDITPSCAG